MIKTTKKIIQLFFILSLMTGTLQNLQSCKNDDADIKEAIKKNSENMDKNFSDLQELIKQLTKQIGDLVKSRKKSTLVDEDLKKSLNTIKSQVDKLKTGLEQKMADSDDTTKSQLTEIKSQGKELKTELEQKMADSDDTTKSQLTEIKSQVEELKTELEQKMADSDDTTKSEVKEIKSQVEELAKKLVSIEKQMEAISQEDEKSVFISTWITNPELDTYQHSKDISEEKQVKLPLVPNGSYNFTVDWGDDTSDKITQFDAEQVKHTYAKEGTYTISIKGELKGWSFGWTYSQDDKKWNYYGDAEKLKEISKWGCLDFGETEYQFFHAKNMSITAEDIPKFTGTTSLKGMFDHAESISTVTGMGRWDVSSVTNMAEMFRSATLFNQDISSWDVSSVTDMGKMFATATKFNQPINSWDVSKVTNMDMIFYQAKKFDQNIGSWNVSKVTNMRSAFDKAESFNQAISSWEVSKVTTMEYMFRDAISFNQNINSWDVSSVINMDSMFNGGVFNQDLNQWNVSNVKNMSSMFGHDIVFKGDISSWDVSNVTSMYNMFNGAHSFKGDLSQWNVSNVKNMMFMFYDADSFNADISNWNVSNVSSMFQMFYNAASFDQNIGSWNISKVVHLDGMFFGVKLSTKNYNALLKGFSVKGSKPPKYLSSIEFDGGSSKYSADHKKYRDILIEKGWKITDGGQEN